MSLHLREARALAARGEDASAMRCYLDVLAHDPDCVDALIELAVLAGSGGYRSAARTAFLRVVGLASEHRIAHVGLGDLLTEEGDFAGALRHYRDALAADPDYAAAHRGLAQCLNELGEPGAQAHFQAGFAGHAVVPQRYRGRGKGIPLLMLVSARGGNVPCREIIDTKLFAVTAVYADFLDPSATLPPHALIVNAIGDADRCGAALDAAERIIADDDAPVINPPARVRQTGRAANADRLAAVPGVIAPRTVRFARGAPLPVGLRLPMLLRSPGYHTGQNFALVRSPGELRDAAAAMPGDDLLLIEFLDARGADGLARKYRVMFIDGVAYPLHLAVGAGWKVHYFTSVMAGDAGLRAEEERFLADMEGTLGPLAMTALDGIGHVLGLDYAGVDFGLARDGSLLLFEANATMAIVPPDADPMWDYRRPAIAAARTAARNMLIRLV